MLVIGGRQLHHLLLRVGVRHEGPLVQVQHVVLGGVVLLAEPSNGGLEVLLGGINSLVMSAEAQARHAELMAMNYIPPTYLSVLDGRVYREEVRIPDATLPSNSQGKRVGLAQQLLHEEMVQSQYKN